MTLLSIAVKYSSEKCQNMRNDQAEITLECIVNSQEQGLRLFLVGVFTLENVITMMGFALVVFLLYILFKKDREDEAKIVQAKRIRGYCFHCGFINDPLMISCGKCGNLLSHALEHEISQEMS